MAWTLLPQVQEERHDVVAAMRAAGAQPQLDHQLRFGQDRKERVQARLKPQTRVTGLHAFLMAVHVKQPRRVQIECIAFASRRKSFQTPPPQRSETAQIASCRSKARKESRQTRLACDPVDTEQLRHHRIATKICDMRKLSRFAQKPMRERQGLIHRSQVVV